ncbi:MAG TPA: hypothetical protein VGP68_11925 [Gemmataceae bacterium]|jgi:hypothetical protein|nr:hypothetical protein [Gemmataceae bacterium]
MAGKKRTKWGCPGLYGILEISKSRQGIFIGGDPEGLRTLGEILIWLANVDQTHYPTMPDGERCHTHLYANYANEPGKLANHLTEFSTTTELCRLDAKGTGDLPKKYLDKGLTRKQLRKR